ncbi:MAG: TetR family transcriptional regulator [Pseudomonadota bacterium]
MAKKPATGSGGSKRRTKADATVDHGRTVIEAALRLAASRGWRDLSLLDIADEAGLSLAEVYALYPSKQAVLGGFSRLIDQEVLSGDDVDGRDESARDRLFEVLMRRFDALQPHRDGVSRILAAVSCDPFAALCGAKSLRRSMATMLEAAGLSASGCRGMLRVKGLSAIYLSSLKVWLKDESQDMAKTMAALDKKLNQADGLVRRCQDIGSKSAKPEDAGQAA